MKFKEFLEIVKTLNIDIRCLKTYEYFVELEGVEHYDENTVICKSWIKGIVGAWETTPSFISEKEPEFESLDQILYAICPDIPYLKYKKLLLLQEHKEINEAYSSRVHIVAYIKLDQLHEELRSLNLIGD